MNYKSVFDCDKPIIAMAMNGVSDVDLAVSVFKAGAFPSISVFNYFKEGKTDWGFFIREVERFKQTTGTNKILISMLWEQFLHKEVIDILIKLKVEYIELFIRPHTDGLWSELSKTIDYLKKDYNFKFFFKSTGLLPACNYDGIILKGPDGAGRSFENTPPLEEGFEKVISKTDKGVIPSGGIGTADQVSYYMSKGALAVGVGTLIAASEESCVSKETKQKIIESSSADIQKFGTLGCRGLLFSEFNQTADTNNTAALRAGIKDPLAGCLYMGNGIDYIKEILPVKDIIELLTKDLNDNQ